MILKNKIASHFLISAPRSGSTWLQTMYNAHPKLACVERRLFGNYADMVLDDGAQAPRLRVTLDKYVQSMLLHHGYPKSQQKKLTQNFIKALLQAEQETLGKPVVVDKITPYLNTSAQVVSQLTTYFPKAKVLYLVRDGRDVLTSGVFHWFNKQPANKALTPFERQRRDYFIHGKGERPKRFFQDKEIEQWANEWQQPLQTIDKAKQHHKVHTVTYEAMLTDTTKVLEECFGFFQVKTTKKSLAACLSAGQFKTMSQGRKQGEAKANAHVRKGVSGDWKQYFTYTDGKLFHDIAGEILLQYGYETNENWYERLR
ncbi:sulfotransferase domain-containing protein [Mangrovimonas cancribranchiae]|uniref:Sulfotransferase domain-containing protein n=1 Tax=Mangrovimonas cancribranchiae TaxID=3080055 RepID=A0AAU6P9J4_9FLAO